MNTKWITGQLGTALVLDLEVVDVIDDRHRKCPMYLAVRTGNDPFVLVCWWDKWVHHTKGDRVRVSCTIQCRFELDIPGAFNQQKVTEIGDVQVVPPCTGTIPTAESMS